VQTRGRELALALVTVGESSKVRIYVQMRGEGRRDGDESRDDHLALMAWRTLGVMGSWSGDLRGVGPVTAGEVGGAVQCVPRTPNTVLRGIRENERHESQAEFAEAMARLAREMGVEVYPDWKYVQRLESGIS
jgi:hypothetical protein